MEHQEKYKIGIVGHGFVGQAVSFGFETPLVEKFIVDPKLGTTIDQLEDWDPHFVFVCVPTPMKDNGHADCSIVTETVSYLLNNTGADIIIKSTVPPQIVEAYQETYDTEFSRVLYNPEFLTESNPLQQFVNPEFMIIGGYESHMCDMLYNLYLNFSRVVVPPTSHIQYCSCREAAYIKYAINSFLAMKVTFFNQLYDAVDGSGCMYNIIAKGVGSDSRIGTSHIHVPGFDGKRGFGGACFPKDISSFVNSNNNLTLLREVININNSYRSKYKLDEREVDNSVVYFDKNKKK